MHPRFWWIPDALIVLILFGASAVWGANYANLSRAAGRDPAFYQEYFEPAVMVACGRGFHIATPARPPALDEFLFRRSDAFDCRHVAAIEVTDKGLVQAAWRYLLVTVGVAWKLMGAVSWSGLAPLFGVLFAMSIVAVYGLFRFVSDPIVAALCAIGLALSTLHLVNLVVLRDYAKAPFILLFLLIMTAAVVGRFTWRRALSTAVAAGVVIAIGYGFRTDFLAFVPIGALGFLGFVEGPLRTTLIKRTAAAGVFLATFLIAAWPIWSVVTRSGGCQFHVALLGTSQDFTSELHLKPAPYEVLYAYFDGFAYRQVGSYAARRDMGFSHIEYCSRDYDSVSGALFADVVRTFPADFAMRAYAAVLGTLELPFRWYDAPLPDWMRAVYGPRSLALRVFKHTGILAAALLLAGLVVRNPRLAAYAFFGLLAVGGHTAVQYTNRHHFHLEFFTWLCWAAVVTAAARFAAAALREGFPAAWRTLVPDNRVAVRRLAVGAAVAVAVIVVPLASLRAYQQRRVSHLFQRYAEAPKRDVPLTPMPGGSLQQAAVVFFPEHPAWTLQQSALIEVTVNAWQCATNATVTFRYLRRYPDTDFTRTIVIPPSSTPYVPTRIYFPAFDEFIGLEFSDLGQACIARVAQVVDVREFPLLLTAVLPPQWDQQPLYQRLSIAAPFSR